MSSNIIYQVNQELNIKDKKVELGFYVMIADSRFTNDTRHVVDHNYVLIICFV